MRLIFFLLTVSLVAEETKARIPPLELPDREVLAAYERAAEQNVLAALNPKVFPGYWSVCADGKGSAAVNKPSVLLLCLLIAFVSFATETPKNSTATGGERQMPSHFLRKPVRAEFRTNSAIHMDTGHPWRPPFGLHRVGQPTRIFVEPDVALKPREEALLIGYQGGHEALRERVEFITRSAVVKEMDPSIDRVVLLAGGGQTWRETASLAIERNGFEADAEASPEVRINPIDLGAVFPPADCFLLKPGQRAHLRVAAFCRTNDVRGARVVAWFDSRPSRRAETALELSRGKRSEVQFNLPEPSFRMDRDILQVSIQSSSGAELWRKKLHVMLVRRPPAWPKFGASQTRLRYDLPISLRNPKTGTLSSMPYEQGWAPQFRDVVVSLPNGSRFVFWRGTSYVPFWAGQHNTGLSYEWAETGPLPEGFVDSVEPLMDKELRYGRVQIVESTAARVHVRWSYQSCDFNYKVWGDAAEEDFYFYPDGFGTRVLTLRSALGADYELSEFIVLAPAEGYPLDLLPENPIRSVALDGTTSVVPIPFVKKEVSPRPKPPLIYRVQFHKEERETAVYFNPRDPFRVEQLVIFRPFYDRGYMVTPAYWGSSAMNKSSVLSLCLLTAFVSLAAETPKKFAADVDVSKLPPAAGRAVDFTRDIQPIFTANCLKCHGPEKQKGGFRVDVKEVVLRGGDNYAPAIRPGKSEESPLIHFVAGLVDDMLMPQKGERLSPEAIGLLRAWIDQGANWPDDGKAKELHWSLKLVTRPAVPSSGPKASRRNPIDAFILARLQAEKLTLSPEADRRTLIRRLSFDLIGLPPTPEEVSAFLADKSSDAYGRLVERLLASPRYGERWARHWLDVVRFAETTGFEVNTPRNNAWPYRDYVIRAFNDDKPYNQFVREQLAGDLFGEDAATGFLVGGANDQVKSPDVVLTSQQRADDLHDMVATTGSAFLGLTIGCARCHNHKFDPIPQTDYFAVKAVFAGVQHGERPLKTPGYEERLKEAEQLRQRVTHIEGQLVQFEPLANPLATNQPAPNPRLNEEKFPPVMVKFVRFTIHETSDNLNPCLDELEVFTAGESSTNVALASNVTKATASGTYPNSEIHRLEHVNDGKLGNNRSWISSEPGKGWVQLEFPAPVMIERIIWGRDREENFKDRLATSYEIEAGEDAKLLRRVAGQAPARPAVHPRLNVERFAPVVAKRLRFTITETTGAEPCIDELEVYTVEQGNQPTRNVALASTGTKATASGTYPNSEIHRLEHINDGKFGNSRSWISSETGKGWVELEFPEAVTINKVVWGRDREEKFKDRLATNYKIEVASGTNAWQVIASAADRRKYKSDEKFKPTYRTADLTEAEVARLNEFLADLKQHEAKIKELTGGPKIYGGTFAKPEVTYRQHRGDPMQPREVIEPGPLGIIPVKFDLAAAGSPTVSPTDEQRRRLALANWIADTNNPLTARVMVNRVWQHHFGQGLVATPSDFGANGAKPSHPELLDWLASEFVARGWSVKALHRLIVTSATYRQAGTERREGLARDASARWLWRFPPRRLEAEPIRDAILAVSGKLDLKSGGPGYSVFEPNDNYVRVYNARQEFGPDGWRRMIYMTKVRMQQDATFGAFDCPDGGQITPMRSSSTTPLQALNLLNSGFLMQQAGFFVERLQRERSGNVAAQVDRAFELAFNRPPQKKEAAAAVKFVEQEGLTVFCRALLNANEFVYLF